MATANIVKQRNRAIESEAGRFSALSGRE
jgi:hypothetical protein